MFHVKATKSLGTRLLYFLSCFVTDKTQLVGNPSIGNDPSGLPYFEQKEEKKKNQSPLLKVGMLTLFRTFRTGVGTTAMGFYRGRERDGINSEHISDKWGFIAEEGGGDQWLENFWEETSGLRKFLHKLT